MPRGVRKRERRSNGVLANHSLDRISNRLWHGANRQMEGQEVKRLLIGTLLGALALVVIYSALPTNAQQTGNCVGKDIHDVCAPIQTSFDHSNCQYPDRWTNPVNGCDNSDPAVPECIKAFSTEQGEKDCIDAFVKQHETPELEPVQIMEGK